MTDCTMGHKKQTLPNGTTAEIVICMKLTDYNKNDQKAVFDFFDEYSNSFFTVKIPGIAGEVKEAATPPNLQTCV